MEMNRAAAKIKGGALYPNITGNVYFLKTHEGVEVTADIYNLPPFSRGDSLAISPFGFHLHEGESCAEGTVKNPFPKTGGHYNPNDQPHGNHDGDFPVLFPTLTGRALMSFLTDRFTIADVLGKTVVIHQSPDDYRTQPSGNSGVKIACGVIQAV